MPRKTATSQMNLQMDSLITRVFSNLNDSMTQQHNGKTVSVRNELRLERTSLKFHFSSKSTSVCLVSEATRVWVTPEHEAQLSGGNK